MNIKCPFCDKISEVDCEIVEGQHLLCPYCNRKFTYGHGCSTIVLPPVSGLQARRGDERTNSPSNKKHWVITGGVIAVCFLVVVCFIVLLSTGGSRPKKTPIGQCKRESAEVVETTHHVTASEGDARGVGERAVYAAEKSAGQLACEGTRVVEGVAESDKADHNDGGKESQLAHGLGVEGEHNGNKERYGRDDIGGRHAVGEVPAKAETEKIHHYTSNESIDLDLNGKIDMQQVFGLRWGEKPRRTSCKFPCEVIYNLEDDIFSEVKLCYGEKDGLIMVCLGRKGREKTRVASSRAFDKMIGLAKNAAGGRYKKVQIRAGWSGLPDDGNIVSVMFFERTLDDDNPERTFIVIRPNEKALKEKAKQAEKLKAGVEKKRRWYNLQLGRHNLNEHSFQVRDTGDGDGYVYCLCLFQQTGLTLTITEGRGMLICDGPVDREYAAALLAVRKEIYRVDGK